MLRAVLAYRETIKIGVYNFFLLRCVRLLNSLALGGEPGACEIHLVSLAMFLLQRLEKEIEPSWVEKIRSASRIWCYCDALRPESSFCLSAPKYPIFGGVWTWVRAENPELNRDACLWSEIFFFVQKFKSLDLLQ